MGPDTVHLPEGWYEGPLRLHIDFHDDESHEVDAFGTLFLGPPQNVSAHDRQGILRTLQYRPVEVEEVRYSVDDLMMWPGPQFEFFYWYDWEHANGRPPTAAGGWLIDPMSRLPLRALSWEPDLERDPRAADRAPGTYTSPEWTVRNEPYVWFLGFSANLPESAVEGVRHELPSVRGAFSYELANNGDRGTVGIVRQEWARFDYGDDVDPASFQPERTQRQMIKIYMEEERTPVKVEGFLAGRPGQPLQRAFTMHVERVAPHADVVALAAPDDPGLIEPSPTCQDRLEDFDVVLASRPLGRIWNETFKRSDFKELAGREARLMTLSSNSSDRMETELGSFTFIQNGRVTIMTENVVREWLIEEREKHPLIGEAEYSYTFNVTDRDPTQREQTFFAGPCYDAERAILTLRGIIESWGVEQVTGMSISNFVDDPIEWSWHDGDARVIPEAHTVHARGRWSNNAPTPWIEMSLVTGELGSVG